MLATSRWKLNVPAPVLALLLVPAFSMAMACGNGEDVDPNSDEGDPDAGMDASAPEDTGSQEDTGDDEDTGSDEEDAGEDDEVAPAACETTLELADEANGLDSGADAQHLQYFAFEELLCAFDPDSGEAFEVDSGLNPISELTILTPDKEDESRKPVVARDDDGALYVDRIVYLADGELRSATTDATADSPPEPRIIDSTSSTFMIAPDLNDPDRGGIAYGPYFGGGWRAKRLGDDESTESHSFGEERFAAAPITDWDSGEAIGWLAMERHDGTPARMAVLKTDLDGEQQGDLLIEPTGDLRNVLVFFDAQLRDGSWIFSAGHDSTFDPEPHLKFFHYDRSENTAEYVGSLVTDFDSSTNEMEMKRATDGSAAYVIGRDVDDTAQLARIDGQGVEVIDREDHPDTDRSWPEFVAAGDDHIVWAWSSGGFGSSPLQVRAWNKSEETMETIFELGPDDRSIEDTAFVGGGHVFFTTRNGGNWAHAIDLDTGDEQLFDDNMHWVGSSLPSDAYIPYGVSRADGYAYRSEETLTLVSEVSEVFLADRDDVSVVSASEPSTAVELGETDGTRNLSMNAFGLGPHRLLRVEDRLYYADASTEDSLRLLIDDSDEADETRLRVLPGF